MHGYEKVFIVNAGVILLYILIGGRGAGGDNPGYNHLVVIIYPNTTTKQSSNSCINHSI